MIPSDHFVRFYNEVFKKLDAFGELEPYYEAISRHQELHCLKEFREKGLQGVYDYYVKIRREENCDMDMELEAHCLKLFMRVCPSLSKAMDNDAGACALYCNHCPGWTTPLYKKAGLFQVYDVMGHDNPQCCEWIFDDLAMAEAKRDELLKTRPKSEIWTSF